MRKDMKTTKLIKGGLLAAIMLLSIAGCERENKVFLKVETENLSKPKVYLASDHYIYWNDGESILVNGSECEVSIDGSSIGINGADESESGYIAAFPANFAPDMEEGDLGDIYLPEVQTYEEVLVGSETYQKIPMPMVAIAGTGEDVLRFHNTASLMKLTIANPAPSYTFKVSQIEVISSDDDCPLSGYGSINGFGGDSPTIELDSYSSQLRTILDCSEHDGISGSNTADFYIVIPPISSTTNKLTIVVDGTANGQCYHFERTQGSSATTVSVGRNKLVTVPAITSGFSTQAFMGRGTEDSPYIISTTAEWNSLVSTVNSGNSYTDEYFNLTNNINLGTATPIGTSSNKFKGIFNGNNHTVTITGFNAVEHTGLFGCIEDAEISDLTVSGSATSSGAIGYYGALCGQAISSTITKCTTSATSDVTTTKNYPLIGGLIGELNGGSANKVSNSGSLTVHPSSTECNAGGIFGKGTNATIRNAANTGSVTVVSGATNTYVGGIIGWLDGSGTSNVKNAFNQANISAPSSDSDVGGICGHCANSSQTVENCYNSGNLSGTTDRIFGIIGYNGTASYCYHTSTDFVGSGGSTTNCKKFTKSSGKLASKVTINGASGIQYLDLALNAWCSTQGLYYSSWTALTQTTPTDLPLLTMSNLL